VDSPVGLFYAILQKPKSLSCLYYVGQEVGRARNRPPINICLYTSHFAVAELCEARETTNFP
jgi:hypothetical protein